MSLPGDLEKLACILADWVEPAKGFDIYLFGSRVRGDHRTDSDVDVVIPIPRLPTPSDAAWWSEINEDNFKAINAELPGPLQILENSDPIADKVRSARVVYCDRQVTCVWMEQKDRRTAVTGGFGV